MKDLLNLHLMAEEATSRFSEYQGFDFVLPESFKNEVKEINKNKISYNKYSAIIETRGVQRGMLNIFMPNQWFYIASYFTAFYNELQRYKALALKVATKERLKELNGGQLSFYEQTYLDSLEISPTSRNFLKQFITDYQWWGGAKTIDRGDFYVSPILTCANLVNASQSFVADLCAFLSDKPSLCSLIIQEVEHPDGKHLSNSSFVNSPLQQIFYGAPGTGKSHGIKSQEVQFVKVIRTTFHPDSDYSTFVGAYKPIRVSEPKQIPFGNQVITPKDAKGQDVMESKISYSFVKQAFLKAYIEAWKRLDKGEKVLLVIEEINRGNCAQIFGDLFQLLDREDNGYSSYPIEADEDLRQELEKEFAEVEGLPENIKSGEEMLLPCNLYIWATMNTSDQSLFPIDSAFKRRWDWKYVPINTHKEDWSIEVNGQSYDWGSFLDKINFEIGDSMSSEDKKLGFYFCKAEDGVITAERFVSKVLFYIYNDVFKDYGFDSREFFKDKDTQKPISFQSFYNAVDGKVDEVMVEKILTNLEVEASSKQVVNADEPEDEQETSPQKYPFVVSFDDGTTFSSESMSKQDLFIKALQHIGLDKIEPLLNVQPLPFSREQCPIVSKTKYDVIENHPRHKYAEVDGYYIICTINDRSRVPLLEFLREKLAINFTITSPFAK